MESPRSLQESNEIIMAVLVQMSREKLKTHIHRTDVGAGSQQYKSDVRLIDINYYIKQPIESCIDRTLLIDFALTL